MNPIMMERFYRERGGVKKLDRAASQLKIWEGVRMTLSGREIRVLHGGMYHQG